MRAVTITAGNEDAPKDLAAAVFAALAHKFFNDEGLPIPFELRPKTQTQDDPFDEHVRLALETRLPAELKVFASNKPLVSPDFVVARPEEDRLWTGGSRYDPRRLLAIEVKKLNVDSSGRTGRATGMDYNSTPPCETVTLLAASGETLTIPAYYLFASLRIDGDSLTVPTMALVSGAALNRDTSLYNAATGVREKNIGLGSYGDGLDRVRPMFVFANPLGWDWLSLDCTLIHPRADLDDEQQIERIRKVIRTDKLGQDHEFWCYRPRGPVPASTLPDAMNPFPTARRRKIETSPRGKFRLEF